jgi:mannose-1-phosphate guanylyltransferase
MISANHDKLVLVQGIDDCIVIDTKDVLMICKKEKEQVFFTSFRRYEKIN